MYRAILKLVNYLRKHKVLPDDAWKELNVMAIK